MPRLPELRVRIVAWGGFFILLFFFVLSLLAAYIVWQAYRSQLMRHNHILSSVVAQAIEEYLDQPRMQIDLLALVLAEGGSDYSTKLAKVLDKTESRFQRVEVLDSLGLVEQVYPENSAMLGGDMSGQAYYQETRQSRKPYWTPVFLGALDEVATAAYAVPFGSKVLVAYLSMEHLSAFQLPKEIAKDAQVFVTDQNGTLLLHPDLRRVREREVFPLFRQARSQANERGFSYMTFTNAQGVQYCSATFLSSYGWGVFMVQPRKEAMKPVLHLLGVLAVTALVIALISLGVAYMGFRRVFWPLQEIVKQMAALGSGESKARIPPARFQEFQQIAEQFNAMADQVQERQHILSQLNETLRIKNQELESMLYISSHDLRTPLVNISGFVSELSYALKDLLQEADAEAMRRAIRDELSPMLQFVTGSCLRMDQLLRSLLKLARMSRSEPELVEVDLDDVFEQVRQDLDHALRQHNANIQSANLGNILGAQTEIHQILLNLLGNAIKYSRPGVPPLIVLRGWAEAEHRFLEICDNGIGIPPENLHRIFDIFYRVGENAAVDGEGIGLTIVQRLMNRQKGSIRVESVPGQGTCFTLCFLASV